jgi:hypothetical protein
VHFGGLGEGGGTCQKTNATFFQNVTKSKVDDDDGCAVRRVTRLDVSGLGVKHVPNRSFCQVLGQGARPGYTGEGLTFLKASENFLQVHGRDSTKCIEFADEIEKDRLNAITTTCYLFRSILII